MRRTLMVLIALLSVSLLPYGCGGPSASELTELLAQRCGEIQTISYTRVTEAGDVLYREEFELRFPDAYRYRFYEIAGGESRLLNLTVQSGYDLYRAGILAASSEDTGSIQIENFSAIPPLRCTGTYLALYPLVGNVDYFQSMISLLEAGELVVSGSEDVDGVDAFRLESASGLEPRMRMWLDRQTGFPLRKELTLDEGGIAVFRYEDYEENQPYAEELFPPDALPLFGELDLPVVTTARDGACRPLGLEAAADEAGFMPLVPKLPGFEIHEVFIRDPAISDVAAAEGSSSIPPDFRELYLVLRNGSLQVEIRENPYDPEYGYNTPSPSALSGTFLTSQERFDDDAANAAYVAAVDCQQMRLVLGGVEIVVTGDLSRDEMEGLAVQLKALATH